MTPERLIDVLRAAGLDLSATEIADAIWLATRLGPVSKAAPPKVIMPPGPDEREPTEPEGTTSTESSDADRPVRPGPEPGPAAGAAAGIDLRIPRTPGLSYQIPAATALPGSLGISRALRPLMQKVPSRSLFLVDEDATAQRVAEERKRTWDVVLRPAAERRLELALVVERSPSMVLWTRTVEHLRLLFERQGAFRDVRVWGLRADPGGELRLVPQAGRGGGEASLGPRALIAPAVERLILLASDGLSRAWRDGSMTRVLRDWGERHPTAVVQMLPPRLWPGTAMNQTPVSLRAPDAVVPNTRLTVDVGAGRPRRRRREPGQPQSQQSQPPQPLPLPLPVVWLEPAAAANWARMVAGVGGARATGVLLPDRATAIPLEERGGEARSGSSGPAPIAVKPEERVQQFMTTASPGARKLAGYLAAVPLTLPVMRLVQREMLPGSLQTDLAEVFLGGLLTRITPEARGLAEEDVVYDFWPGVREVLLTNIPTADTLRVLDLLASRAPKPFDVRTILADPDAAVLLDLAEASRPLVVNAAAVLRILGGPFTRTASALERRLRQPAAEEPGAPPPGGPTRPRILHLSELHINDSHDLSSLPFQALPAALRALVARGEGPDVVVISGNVTHAARPESFDLAHSWITGTLLPALGLGSDRVIVVPGTHDMMRDGEADARIDSFRWESLKNQSGAIQSWWDSSGEEQVREWHSGFSRFATSFSPSLRPGPYPWGASALTIGGLRVGFARLCASWACSRREKNFGRLFVGRPQLDEVFRDLDLVDADLNVAVSHIPPRYLADFDREEVESVLAREDCPILLHGCAPAPAPLSTGAVMPHRELVTTYQDGRVIGLGVGGMSFALSHMSASNGPIPEFLSWGPTPRVGPPVGPFALITVDLARFEASVEFWDWDPQSHTWTPGPEPGARTIRASWLTPPSADQLAELPRWALVALLARCLRRALPVLSGSLPPEGPPEHRGRSDRGRLTGAQLNRLRQALLSELNMLLGTYNNFNSLIKLSIYFNV